MKVLSYLEFRSLGYQDYGKNYECYLKSKNIADDFDYEFEFFYSQPFQPELITELFEGWEYLEDEFIYINGKYLYDSDCDLFGYNDGVNYGNANMNWITFRPRTLDDFINDCQRAGIELTWKTNG